MFGMNNVQTHNYTKPRWGHSVEILKISNCGFELRVVGYGRGVGKDDFLLLSNEGSSTRYKVLKIEHKGNGTEQWFADLEFAPRAP
jgi:hypothetical protein